MAATKTYTASLGRDRGAGGRRRRASWPRSPTRWRASSAVAVPFEAAAAWERLAVVGRGVAYGTAFEAALKLSELTGVIAAPWSSADFLHGPIAIVEPGFPILAIAPSGPTLDGMRELLAAASRARRRRHRHQRRAARAAAGSPSSPCRSGSRRSSPSSPPNCSPSAPPSTSAATSTARPASRRSRSRHERGRSLARDRHRGSQQGLQERRRTRSTTSASRSATASSWCSSARRAAASRRC